MLQKCNFTYYEDFFYTLISEEPKTSLDNLVGTIGGLLGLFLGASLMSFYELIDMVFSTIFIIIANTGKIISFLRKFMSFQKLFQQTGPNNE